MPVLDDIPMHLRGTGNQVQFLLWVNSLPVEAWVKRSLTNIWQKLYSVRFSASDYTKAGL